MRLKAAVYVQDPATREELILLPGECPEPEIVALITHPDAWDVPPEASPGFEPGADPGREEPVIQDVDVPEATAKKPASRRNRTASA
ncbi:hypothetical protein [Streptomyces cavernicola]|uniref:Uncharacterized protein n=1 Tax=Streptomyces cavernicola TaxID=3043613 RepID=A0ABT6SG61_9ACTN|nr:hypothetical protein [Streptomyces sp. B-S-A6]MDI3406271.1 hypothetical protein [Streptomyces sp. B-S-A6]